MAEYLFVVPGYSDEDFSFLPLRNLLIKENLYDDDKIRSIEYASLDDQVDFRDFADKFDDTYNEFIKEHPDVQQIDVLAHSTGSLVVRAWLYLRRTRQLKRKLPIDVPIEYLFLFAPANFGSDLAKIGRSPLNAVRVTFTKLSKSFIVGKDPLDTTKRDILEKSFTLKGNKDPFETGKKVLEGLEPASPTQWELSMGDLHEETYFGEHDPNLKKQCCFPFIFAAGQARKTLESIVVKELQKDGTDSTVRIAGTSLNTRLFTLRSKSIVAGTSLKEIEWDNELIHGTNNKRKKYENIAFAIFGKYDHCGIINNDYEWKKPNNFQEALAWDRALSNQWEPLELLRKAKEVTTPDEYKKVAEEFHRKTLDYIEPKKSIAKEGIFQQFFFNVTDDTGQKVPDFFIQFFVYDVQDKDHKYENEKLTKEFRALFDGGKDGADFASKTSFHVHSIDSSHSVLMLDITLVEKFLTDNTLSANNQIVMKVTANSPYKGVVFGDSDPNSDPDSNLGSDFVIFDKRTDLNKSNHSPPFFSPFTTTLVKIILQRKINRTILNEGDFGPGD